MKTFATLCLILFPFAGQATELTAHHCSAAGPTQLLSHFKNYEQYSQFSGSKYEMSLMGASLPLLTLVKSQSKVLSESSAYVWMVLQPLGVNTAELMPRFLLKCDSSQTTESASKLVCELQKTKTHFGLDDLKIEVNLNSNDTKCERGQTGADLRVSISGNSHEIELIKAEVLKPAGAFKGVLASLFNEDDFFKNYFQNFYSELSRYSGH